MSIGGGDGSGPGCPGAGCVGVPLGAVAGAFLGYWVFRWTGDDEAQASLGGLLGAGVGAFVIGPFLGYLLEGLLERFLGD